MKTIIFTAPVALLLLGLGLVLSCDDDDDSNDDTEQSDGDDDSEELADGYHSGLGYVATDPDSGLKLLFPDVASLLGQSAPQSESDGEYDPNANLNHDYPTSVQACQAIAENTGQNWELTTVSDLRLWIRDCPATIWGGQCGVYDDCMVVETCYDESCHDGCWAGYGSHPDGYYAIDSFPIGAGSGFYWSSTPAIASDSSTDSWRWCVSFEWANYSSSQPDNTIEMRVACALH